MRKKQRVFMKTALFSNSKNKKGTCILSHDMIMKRLNEIVQSKYAYAYGKLALKINVSIYSEV